MILKKKKKNNNNNNNNNQGVFLELLVAAKNLAYNINRIRCNQKVRFRTKNTNTFPTLD